jgi:hypothetical protein
MLAEWAYLSMFPEAAQLPDNRLILTTIKTMIIFY